MKGKSTNGFVCFSFKRLADFSLRFPGGGSAGGVGKVARKSRDVFSSAGGKVELITLNLLQNALNLAMNKIIIFRRQNKNKE